MSSLPQTVARLGISLINNFTTMNYGRNMICYCVAAMHVFVLSTNLLVNLFCYDHNLQP
jgi:hypothetical protein